jgi:predicted deacylase
MKATTERLAGDTPGSSFDLRVLRFAGADPAAPKAYLQAALHGGELPGTVALHLLVPMLRKAEAEGRLDGDITIVPYANPIGLGQAMFGQAQGRFAFGSRINFNRDFPMRSRRDAPLPALDAPILAEKRLKAHLLRLSADADIVLDLHCDDEGLPYLYVPRKLWPMMADLAIDLAARAVLVWEDTADGAFEEAAFAPHAGLPDGDAAFNRLAVSTVELRGIADVSPAHAAQDAAGLYRFLIRRGVVTGAVDTVPAFSGPVTPLANVEMVRAPVGGAILYHIVPGDSVVAGARLCTILTAPGEDGGAVDVYAPQDGLILTRRSGRIIRPGEDLAKLLGSRPSATAGSGSLEA